MVAAASGAALCRGAARGRPVRVLVIGREGQVARSLAEVGGGFAELDLTFAARPELDLQQDGSARAAILAHRPDVVINAAAYTAVDQAEQDVDRAFRINAEAVGEIGAAAREIGARVVHLSTDYVFSGSAAGPLREDDAVAPVSVYGRTKLEGEERLRAECPSHAILRTSWVISPFGRNFVRTMMNAARDREVLTVVDDQRGCPTSALDLAGGILTLVERWRAGERVGLGETYHLAGTGETSWCGLAAEVMKHCRELGLPSAEVKPIRTADWPTPATRPMNSVLDSGKFARELGFVMPHWRESVRTIVERLAAEAG